MEEDQKGILYVNDYKNPKYYECVYVNDQEMIEKDYIIDSLDFIDGFHSCFNYNPNKFNLINKTYGCDYGCTGYSLDYLILKNDVISINKKKVKITKYDDKEEFIVVHNNCYANLSYTYFDNELKSFFDKIKTIKPNTSFKIGDYNSYASLFSYSLIEETNEPILQKNPFFLVKCPECDRKISFIE